MKHVASLEFERINKILTDDLHEIARMRGPNPSAGIRRLYMRTLFTYFEGNLYAFKQMVLALEEILAAWQLPKGTSHVILYKDEERAMLKEFTYRLSGCGEAQIAPMYPKFADSFKFTMNVLHRAMRLESKVDYGGAGWKAVMGVQEIRNRLIHPKCSMDLEVAESELAQADAASDWYENTMESVLNRLYEESFWSPRFAKT